MSYDHSKKFLDKYAMDSFVATDSAVAKKYGETVRAIQISNREYWHRYEKLSDSRTMKPPPGSWRRIFPGYLVVRKLDTALEYETWIPEDGFNEMYERIDGQSR